MLEYRKNIRRLEKARIKRTTPVERPSSSTRIDNRALAAQSSGVARSIARLARAATRVASTSECASLPATAAASSALTPPPTTALTEEQEDKEDRDLVTHELAVYDAMPLPTEGTVKYGIDLLQFWDVCVIFHFPCDFLLISVP